MDLEHTVAIGNSIQNQAFPKNSFSTSLLIYFKLFCLTLWAELNSFYSIYYIVLGILEFFPDVSTISPWSNLLPLIVVVGFSYLTQAFDTFKLQRSTRMSESAPYHVSRDHQQTRIPSRQLMPGDYIILDDSSSMQLPCDCVLVKSTAISIFIDTSIIDGEIDVKDTFPLHMPDIMTMENTPAYNGTLYAPLPLHKTRPVSGKIVFAPDSSAIPDQLGHYQIDSENTITVPFEPSNFVERGTIIRTSGTHLFLVVYTGSHCRTITSTNRVTHRTTIIDHYIEKLALFVFCFQFLFCTAIAATGYWIHLNRLVTYPEPIMAPGFWKYILLFVRNFLLVSLMIPITLKITLPIFRFFYGLFITYDNNFTDPVTNIKADAISTTMTENLGCLDFIVSDKTGTLTKNLLEWVSFTCGDKKFGNTKNAPTILEDGNLHELLYSKEDPLLMMMLFGFALCHSCKVNDNGQPLGSSQDDISIVTQLVKLGFKFNFHRPGEISFQIGDMPSNSYRFEILKVTPFNRKRMRMSVVVRNETGTYVFMKGAPERVLSHCEKQSGQQAGAYQEFMKQGYRTLVMSYKKIEEYNDQTTKKEIESGYELLGSFAIEDALQQDVQLTLKLLGDAGIKLWIATGDAHTNTVVTACTLNYMDPKDPIVHLTTAILKDSFKVSTFISKSFMAKPNSFTTLINCEDPAILSQVLEEPNFLNALAQSKAVIFYRCQPGSKADLVVALQNIGKRVMAVGDGANDNELLRTADVGVGMIGENGDRSFTSCDFAIPAFRSLSRLILIHGHNSIHRSILTVHFSFYKAVLFGVCQMVFQFWTDFTGGSFFDDFAINSYNLFWTLIPLLAILFDKDVSDNFLYRLSYLYKKLRNPMSLAPSNLNWFYVACYQSVIVMLVGWLLTGENFTQEGHGTDMGANFLSICVFFALMFINTFYMVYQLNVMTYYSFIILVGNLVLLITFSTLIQSHSIFGLGGEWIGFFGECFNDVRVLIKLVTMILAAVSPSWLGLTVWTEFAVGDTLLVIEQETIAAREDRPLFFDPPKKIK